MDKISRIRFSPEEKYNILNKTKCRCAHCGSKLNINTMTVEHIYPIHKGGDNSEFNLVALCEKCNKSKSNFLFDLSYFPFIMEKHKKYYEKQLLTNIYSSCKGSNIFSDADSIITVVDGKYANMMTKKNCNNIRALKLVSKQYELMKVFPGDVTEEMLELVGSVFVYVDSGKTAADTINKYAFINLVKQGTVYGIYHNKELLAVLGYIDIRDLDIKDEKFLNELSKLGYDNTYVEVVCAYKDKNEFIRNNISNKIANYMTFTNNLVLLGNTCVNFFDIVRPNINNKIQTDFRLPANIQYMGDVIFMIYIGDDNFNTSLKNVEIQRKYFDIK